MKKGCFLERLGEDIYAFKVYKPRASGFRFFDD